MSFYNWFNFECFWRNEEKPLHKCKEKKLQLENTKVEFIEHLICSRCFIFVNNTNDYHSRAIIGNNHYGFCSDECYKEWLNPGFQKYLGKINKH